MAGFAFCPNCGEMHALNPGASSAIPTCDIHEATRCDICKKAWHATHFHGDWLRIKATRVPEYVLANGVPSGRHGNPQGFNQLPNPLSFQSNLGFNAGFYPGYGINQPHFQYNGGMQNQVLPSYQGQGYGPGYGQGGGLPPPATPSSNSLECPSCQRQCKTAYGLRMHIKDKHSDKKVKRELPASAIDNGLNFQCLCGAEFGSLNDQDAHAQGCTILMEVLLGQVDSQAGAGGQPPVQTPQVQPASSTGIPAQVLTTTPGPSGPSNKRSVSEESQVDQEIEQEHKLKLAKIQEGVENELAKVKAGVDNELAKAKLDFEKDKLDFEKYKLASAERLEADRLASAERIAKLDFESRSRKAQFEFEGFERESKARLVDGSNARFNKMMADGVSEFQRKITHGNRASVTTAGQDMSPAGQSMGHIASLGERAQSQTNASYNHVFGRTSVLNRSSSSSPMNFFAAPPRKSGWSDEMQGIEYDNKKENDHESVSEDA